MTNKEIDTAIHESLQGRIAELEAALREAQADVCSLHCPSTWRTGEKQPHSDKCQAIAAALAPDDTNIKEQQND